MVVFSFLLGAAEKKTVENEHKVLQSRQVVSQYLTLAISLTQTLSLSLSMARLAVSFMATHLNDFS